MEMGILFLLGHITEGVSISTCLSLKLFSLSITSSLLVKRKTTILANIGKAVAVMKGGVVGYSDVIACCPIKTALAFRGFNTYKTEKVLKDIIRNFLKKRKEGEVSLYFVKSKDSMTRGKENQKSRRQ